MSQSVGDYLWDGSGEPDTEIAELESLLSAYRYRPRPLPVVVRPRRRWRIAVSMASAAIVLVVSGALLLRARLTWRNGEPWQVTPLAGAPRVGGTTFMQRTQLAVGEVLETDDVSRARVRIASIGSMEVEPGSRLRLVTTRTRHHRLALDFGTIHARLWAPPFSFGVQTPSSTALDLGCAFTLHVNRDGYGLLQVASGWVVLERDLSQTLVPAGAEAVTRPDVGLGTAYFADATEAFRQGVARFDTQRDDPIARAHALSTILAAARPRDAMTLLMILRKLPREERPRLLDRLTQFVPIPAGFRRDDLLDLQPTALDAYWHKLGLGNAKSWILNWRDVLG
jgi:hypothetical protein